MDLQEISNIAANLVELERQVAAKEEALSALNARVRGIKEETIPMAMQELGLSSITLTTGEQLSVFQEVYASIPVANREQAYEWLEEHGFGGLIKISVNAEFGKGERERAEAAFNLMYEFGAAPELSRGVHAQTLKAFLKEQLATGSDIDLDLFGARPTWSTKIKSPKG